jgi:multicomponent Na+:H+ antiporter subunit D
MDPLPLMIALPLGMGFVLPLVPARRVRLADVLTNLAAGALLVMAVALTGRSGVYRVGGWPPPVGINLVLDGLSWLMLLTVAVVSFAATLFSARYMDRYTARPRYYALFMIMVAGMNAAVLTGDLFNLYVFIEVAAVASYALVGFGCEREELEAAFKYAVLGSVASSFILLGIAFAYCLFGTVNLAHLSQKLAALPPGDSARTAALFSLTLFCAGFGLKAALVPFHAWLPDAHPSAPAPISAMLSGVLIKAIGVYALIRVLFTVFGVSAQVSQALMVLGTLSMVVGVFLAIVQWDFKRLLAYHSISQIGYVMLGIGVGGAVLARGGDAAVAALAFAGALFHLVNHAVFKSLLFLTAGAVEYAADTRDLKAMGGLRERMPVTAGTSLVASMSIAGVPPFNGFFSKLLIIVSCVLAGFYGYAAWAVVVSIMTLASFMKVQKYAFFGEMRERWATLREVPFVMQAAMVLLAVLCLAMSALALPQARARFLEPARRSLVDRQGYVAEVLGPALAEPADRTVQMAER